MPASSIQHRPAKTWNKIIIEADSRMTEAVASYLADLSGSGVEISSSEGDLINDIDNPAAFEKITTYISIDPSDSENETISKKINELKQFLANLPLIFTECPAPKFFTEMIIEEDWGKAWKSFFTSFQITPKLTIKPSWEKTKKQSQEDNGEHIIEMDPGLAFGTGHHARTQMALLLLEELYQSRTMKLEKVLDVGTGSGILAMGCGLFGAINVLAIDNDPDAVETAKGNIIRNRLEDIITVSDQDIASIESGFNLIVANIIHDTLA